MLTVNNLFNLYSKSEFLFTWKKHKTPFTWFIQASKEHVSCYYTHTDSLEKNHYLLIIRKLPQLNIKLPCCGASAPCWSPEVHRPRITMECSQTAAWTTNRSLLVASRDRPFQEDRPIPARPYPELRTWMVV